MGFINQLITGVVSPLKDVSQAAVHDPHNKMNKHRDLSSIDFCLLFCVFLCIIIIMIIISIIIIITITIAISINFRSPGYSSSMMTTMMTMTSCCAF